MQPERFNIANSQIRDIQLSDTCEIRPLHDTVLLLVLVGEFLLFLYDVDRYLDMVPCIVTTVTIESFCSQLKLRYPILLLFLENVAGLVHPPVKNMGEFCGISFCESTWLDNSFPRLAEEPEFVSY